MRANDLILFTAVFLSMGVAVLFPGPASVFQPYMILFVMLLLFLSFLKIDFRALFDSSAASLIPLAMLAVVKLVALPAILYFVTLLLAPDYAVGVLLLSGISTGVVAPFFGTLLVADVAPILRMVIVTSVAVPFTLPALVKALAGAELDIPLVMMVRLLALVVFAPMILVVIMRRFFPRVVDRTAQWQFPISLILFSGVNLAVFSKYSDFFFGNPGQILAALGVAYLLSITYYLVGCAIGLSPGKPGRLAGGLSLAIMNNVLVIVFASRFFGPLEPLLAAMYMFPYYTMIVPVKAVADMIAAGKEPAGPRADAPPADRDTA